MNCPACGAPLNLQAGRDALTCPYCHSVLLPDKNDDGVRVLGESEGETCPVCTVPLMLASLSDIRIRYCTQCRGLLIPMDSFAALLDAARSANPATPTAHPPDPGELQRRLNCPHCRHAMETHVYAGPGNVVIADCEPCMLNWLDHGKLQRIANAPDAMRDFSD